MVWKPRRIRNLKRSDKDFPVYREEITTRGWVPHVLCDNEGAYWNGFTARDRDSQLVDGLSEAGRKQMINMILDGYFGEEVKEAFVDDGRYWKIRDALITWPNQATIAREGLRVLEVIPRP